MIKIMNKFLALPLIIISLFLCQGTFADSEHLDQKILEQIELGQALKEPEAIVHNQHQLWMTLTTLSQKKLEQEIQANQNNPELEGWLKLALISKEYRNNPKSLVAALDAWQNHYQNHPANNLLPNPLDAVVNKMIAQPKKIALLLPLTGAIAGPGHAILEGFLAAHKTDKAMDQVEIKSYDTAVGDVVELYQKAITEGAEFVVGPLTKDQVAKLASINHPVPTLFLNETGAEFTDNSYTFGLSPLMEAQQVALKAQHSGLKHALIIAPANDWGNDIVKSFTTEWEKNGGDVAGSFMYGAKDDLNKSIQNLLQIPQSSERSKKIKELLGHHIEAVPSRRQDFDTIFLLAYPSKARQIMPLLRYYFAADVPVFATSAVYAGNANVLRDKDLDGIIFCDIPWVFSHQMGVRNWPEQLNSYNRLYALGKNSYDLTNRLNQLMLFPADRNKDGSTLFLKSNKQVAQVFEWGQFKQGLAHSLGENA